MAARTFMARVVQGDSTTMTGFELPFDPKAVFGKVRAPVVVSIGRYRYRSTVFSMGGRIWVPMRRSHRDGAGVRPGQRVKVTMTLAEKPRTVKAPKDLARALTRAGLRAAFSALSYTHQREHVEAIEAAKKAETRTRRIEKCVEMVTRQQRSGRSVRRRG